MIEQEQLERLKQISYFVTDFDEETVTVTLCKNYEDWRKGFKKTHSRGLSKEEFEDYITAGWVEKTKRWIKSHLLLSGYSNPTVIWEPEHLTQKNVK